MLEKIHDILHVWFGDNELDLQEKAKQWWSQNPAFAQELKEKFEGTLQWAKEGKLEPWLTQPISTLAYIILCDQIPRHIYRQSAKAYAYDTLALNACKQGLDKEFEKDLSRLEKLFFYLPISHSEDLDDQNLNLMLYRNLLDDAKKSDEQTSKMLETAYDYAQKRYEIIAQFGRFPHRNNALNRQTTELEAQFLKLSKGTF